MKDWGVVADNLKKAEFSPGSVSAVDSEGPTIWIVDAQRNDSQRFIVRADEKVTAFFGTGKSDSRVRGGFDLVMAA